MKSMKSWNLWSIKMAASLTAAALLLGGCGNANNTAHNGHNTNGQSGSGGKLNVIATFYPMVEFSQKVGGEHVNVTALVPSGVEPHDWEPTPKDVVKVQEADVFVYNGIVENWAEQTLESAANNKRIVVEASKGINLMQRVGDEEEHGAAQDGADEGGLDPHVWLDPVLAQQEVLAIEAAFEQADPANKEDYKANAEAYLAELKLLDDEYTQELTDTKRKDFITQHAAFSYLAKQYGLTQVPIAGLSPEQEPSPEEMARVVQFAKAHDVKTIFFETLVDPKVAQTIAGEVGAATDVLNPLEGLTAEERTNNLDYIGIMKLNLEALKKALNE